MTAGPKSTRRPRPAPKSTRYYETRPWVYDDHSVRSIILAYVESCAGLEPVAEVHATSDTSSGALAKYIVSVINKHDTELDLLRQAKAALQQCLEEGELTFSSELDAEIVLKRLEQLAV